jgi:acetyl esterase/lipase
MHDLPPCLITVGTLDPLLDDSLFLHARLRAAGNPAALHVVDEGIHGFNVFPIAAAREAAGRINAFLGIPHPKLDSIVTRCSSPFVWQANVEEETCPSR